MLRVWQDGRIVQCKNDADLVCYPIDAELHKQGRSLLNWVCEYKIPVRAPSPLIPPHVVLFVCLFACLSRSSAGLPSLLLGLTQHPCLQTEACSSGVGHDRCRRSRVRSRGRVRATRLSC